VMHRCAKDAGFALQYVLMTALQLTDVFTNCVDEASVLKLNYFCNLI
jgi:hypothetical protein